MLSAKIWIRHRVAIGNKMRHGISANTFAYMREIERLSYPVHPDPLFANLKGCPNRGAL